MDAGYATACHMKLFPEKFLMKSQNLTAFSFALYLSFFPFTITSTQYTRVNLDKLLLRAPTDLHYIAPPIMFP